MKKVKFVQDAKLDPFRFYRNPSDVIRDRRLSDEDRLDILDAWEREAIKAEGEEPRTPGRDQLEQLRRIRRELRQSKQSQD